MYLSHVVKDDGLRHLHKCRFDKPLRRLTGYASSTDVF
jgi:hypothetical protein